MANEIFLLVIIVSLTTCSPLITPVNNAFASLRISDLFRITKSDNIFKIIDYRSLKEMNVSIDYKDKIIKDLLFCPRTFDNPLMGYFGRNSNREHVMCVEVLYQSTFTCIITDLKAECKSLKAFGNSATKNTPFSRNTKSISKEETELESLNVKNESNKDLHKLENGIFITETKIYIFILLVVGGLAVVLGLFTTLQLLALKKNREIIHCPNYANLNSYYEAPVAKPNSIETCEQNKNLLGEA